MNVYFSIIPIYQTNLLNETNLIIIGTDQELSMNVVYGDYTCCENVSNYLCVIRKIETNLFKNM